ncbi:hypothetical protein GCM10009810_31060 [Nostocoides vanveenii]|uniref:NodB homology domain-containing protein n=1 Tax=Nostocoides vanveenii TaxID=330835 RepID=A0ABP4X6P1_9MICO
MHVPEVKNAIRLYARNGQSSAVLTRRAVNLARQSLYLTFRLLNRRHLKGAAIAVSSDHGKSWATWALASSLHASWADGWLSISLPSSNLAHRTGHAAGATWIIDNGIRINWSKINAVRLSVEGQDKHASVALDVAELGLADVDRRPAVAFVFDDGYTSILPATEMMKAAGLKGNVALIGKCLQAPCSGNLDIAQAHALQDGYGWDMVNHSMYHVDAVRNYVGPMSLAAYGRDVARGQAELVKAGLNSAPNWFIYPHGSTNRRLLQVVAARYPFARTTMPGEERIPFADPHRVRTFELHYPKDTSEGSGDATALTPASEVLVVRR